MDIEYIAAIIRRGDLGRAAHIALAIAIATDCRFGPVVKAPIAELAEMLGCSPRQVERLKAKAVRWRLVEAVGKQGLRLTHPSQWRYNPLSDDDALRRHSARHKAADTAVERRDNDDVERRDNDDASRRIPPQSVVVPKRRIPPQSGGDALRRIPPHQEGFPPDLLSLRPGKAFRPGEYKEKTNSDGGDDSSASPPVCLSDTQSESTDRGDEWAHPEARSICQRWSFASSDANGIASELKRLASTHHEGTKRGRESVLALVDEIGGESELRDGGQLIGALRNRWPEWTQPGGKLPDAAEILRDDGWDGTPLTERAQKDEKQQPPTAPKDSGIVTVAEAMEMADLPTDNDTDDGEQPMDENGEANECSRGGGHS